LLILNVSLSTSQSTWVYIAPDIASETEAQASNEKNREASNEKIW